MRINSTIGLGVAGQLARTSQAISRSLARLSSGKRIGSSRDDPAGSAQLVRLDSQLRGNVQAIRNLNDTKGLLSVADSAISTQLDIVQRMREIAVQGSSSTITAEQRSSMNAELRQLYEEFDRIARSTEFNGQYVLADGLSGFEVQVGASSSSQLQFDLQGTTANQAIQKQAWTETYKRTASSLGVAAGDVLVADFNEDGHMDYILNIPNQNAVRLGRGDGTFFTATTISGIGDAQEFADMDGDGHLDVILRNYPGGITNIARGDGRGNFSLWRSVASGAGVDPKVADLNNDGKKDLVAWNSTGSTVSIHLASGEGTFTSVQTLTLGGNPFGDLADFDNDGDIDILSAETNGSTYHVHLNDGSGRFTLKESGAITAPGVLFAELGDLNGDGIMDFIVSAFTANQVSVRLGRGDGTFSTGTTVSITGSYPSTAKLYDLDNDDDLDLVAAAPSADRLEVFLSRGDGTFDTMKTFTTGDAPGFMGFGDFNEDGFADIIAPTSGDTSVTYLESIVTNRAAGADVNVTTYKRAQRLIAILDTATENLISRRAQVGSLLSRLDYSSSYLSSLNTSLEEARDRAGDLDIANEVSELTRLQILQQMQVASIGQANLNLQVVLQLLRSN